MSNNDTHNCNLFFTSDLHFFHEKILTFGCRSRRFTTIQEMNEAIIVKIIDSTPDGSLIYSLGDLYINSIALPGVTALIEKLGTRRIINIKGNHDRANNPYTVGNFLMMYNKFGQKTISFAHHPSSEMFHKEIFSAKSFNIGVHICGHVHEDWLAAYDVERDVVNINVGCDLNRLAPYSYSELEAIILTSIKNKDRLRKIYPGDIWHCPKSP